MAAYDQKVIVLSEYKKKQQKLSRQPITPVRMLLRFTLLFFIVSIAIFAVFMWQDYKRTTLFSHNPNEIFDLLNKQETITPSIKEKLTATVSGIEGLEYLAIFPQKENEGRSTKPDYVFSTSKTSVKDTLGMGNGTWHIEYKFKEGKSNLLWNSFIVFFVILCLATFLSWMMMAFKYPKGMGLTNRMIYIK